MLLSPGRKPEKMAMIRFCECVKKKKTKQNKKEKIKKISPRYLPRLKTK